jgi:G:T-mismatch repair DNA endonuclease (very short patch repair protein)
LNGSYWAPKLAENVARDKRTTEALESAGWNVLRVWEHVLPKEAADQVERVLDSADSGVLRADVPLRATAPALTATRSSVAVGRRRRDR